MTSEWALVLLTFVYVVATIFIVISSNRMADATRKQVDELRRQFHEQNRPYVCVRFEQVRSGLMCVSVENTGNSAARDVRISINNDFVASLPDAREQELLRQLVASTLYLSPHQKLYCCLGGPVEFKQLKGKPMVTDVTYKDGTQEYCDHLEIDVGAYGWALVYESPLGDIASHVQKISEELHRVEEKLR